MSGDVGWTSGWGTGGRRREKEGLTTLLVAVVPTVVVPVAVPQAADAVAVLAVELILLTLPGSWRAQDRERKPEVRQGNGANQGQIGSGWSRCEGRGRLGGEFYFRKSCRLGTSKRVTLPKQ